MGVGLLLLFFAQILRYGQSIHQWDWLLLSGALTFLTGLHLAGQVPEKLDHALDRLVHRGTLMASQARITALKTLVRSTGRTWSRRGAVLSAASILLAFLWIYGLSNPLLTCLESVGGFLAGWWLGRMASYGSLPILLHGAGLQLHAEPGHVDQVCGYRPLGDFYLFQAMVSAIPAVFLAAWWLIIPVFPRSYQHWRQPYLWLLALALLFEILCFAVPMLLLHQQMTEQKQVLLLEADRLSHEIITVQQQLLQETPGNQREELEIHLSRMRERHRGIETMATWPLQATSFLRYSLRHAVLCIPLVSEFTGNPRLWSLLTEVLKGLTP